MGLGMLCVFPIAVAILEGEWSALPDFFIGGSVSVALGCALALLMPTNPRPAWLHGMVATAFSWVLVTLLAAIPYALSGHYASFIDCVFDAMSGFTTTGLSLILDLDHLSNSLNTWRHVITFVGGQGVVVLALSFLIGGARGAYELYVGEGKDERLMPHVINTAKAIWRISIAYLALGTLTLGLGGLAIGLPAKDAFYHGLWIYLAAWSTGGFAPMSQNIAFYHSSVYEFLCLLFFVAGSLNFALHHAMLTGRRRELYRNAEIRSFALSFLICFCLVAWALSRAGVYGDVAQLLRKAFFHAISAHTTTGFMTVAARQLTLEWDPLSLSAMILAMMVGGSACSTAGGIKGLRLAGLAVALKNEIKAILLPRHAVFHRSLHNVSDHELDDARVRAFALVTLIYVACWAAATMLGILCGYPAMDAAFEAASVTGNVGLSVGVSSPSMPLALKLAYIAIMWAGRLEFIAVLAMGGFIVSGLRGKK